MKAKTTWKEQETQITQIKTFPPFHLKNKTLTYKKAKAKHFPSPIQSTTPQPLEISDRKSVV